MTRSGILLSTFPCNLCCGHFIVGSQKGLPVMPIDTDSCVNFVGISQTVVVCKIRCHPWGYEMLVSRPKKGNERVLSQAISVLGL